MSYCIKTYRIFTFKKIVKKISKNSGCRICKETGLKKVFSFGPTPLANAFLSENNLKKSEDLYPLDVYYCHKCHLIQLRDVVSSEVLFKDYVYVSSTSAIFIRHFNDFAKHIIKLFKLDPKSLCIDIGSNDGILLQPLKKHGIKVLGIEPAENIAGIANSNNIPTISEFFSVKLANKIVRKYGYADIVCASNVFAHINDLDEVIKGIKILLKKRGVFIIEFPYLGELITKNLFDTVYHEHLSYFSLNPLLYLFKRFSMIIFRVEKVNTHGGSLRIFVAKDSANYKTDKSVNIFLGKEKKLKLDLISTYTDFNQRIEKNKRQLLQLLKKIKKKNKMIIGYGAPAKGNTLLNYFKINKKILDYIVDDSPYKQNLYTPGTHIKIENPKRMYKDKPDYILILAWNFAEAIIQNHPKLKKWSKFIVPVPEPEII